MVLAPPLADRAMHIEPARRLTHYAAWLIDNGLPFNRHASRAKTLATDAAMKMAIDAVQIFGGYGYMRDYPVESIMRDVKINQIIGGHEPDPAADTRARATGR